MPGLGELKPAMPSPLFDLTGRTALVTGATSGIGLSLARGLAAAGARVVVNGRDEARIAATVESLKAEGLAVSGSRFDVTAAARSSPPSPGSRRTSAPSTSSSTMPASSAAGPSSTWTWPPSRR